MNTGAAKFQDLKAALGRDAKIVTVFNTFNGASDIAKFVAKFENNLDGLNYTQTRVFEKNVRYVVRSRIGG